MNSRPLKGHISNDPMHTNVSLGEFEVTDLARKYINEVLDSGRISYGPLCRRYEEVFAGIHSAKGAVLSNSGTSSLQVALQALKQLHGWPDGSEVIVPALTFVATVNACLHNRLTPVLVDIEPTYYGIDPELILPAITSKTRCILPVHPFGQPADMPRIMDIANHFRLSVVEDSCESMFVSVGNRFVGSFGDVGCFSTYAAHIINTGVGGIATSSNPDLLKLMRSLVNHGIDLTELPTGTVYDPTYLARKFRFTSIGHSFRITELEAALGLAQLDQWRVILEKRQENAKHLTRNLTFAKDHFRTPKIRPRSTHAFMMYPIVMETMPKETIMNHLMVRGVETREMLPLTNQPCYSGLFNPLDYPVSNHINHHGFYVGCHQGLTRQQLDYMIHEIHVCIFEGEANVAKGIKEALSKKSEAGG